MLPRATQDIPRLAKHSPQNTGESGRNEYCNRYHDSAWAGDNLYGSGGGGGGCGNFYDEDVMGGDFRHNYGAGVDDDFVFWDFDDLDIDDCENDYYDEYGDDLF
jgi:hypothetical protein